ncbi:MFS general substrate transporter [Wallemia mellicola]|uniref:MFS general substrate transporter n=1 Tax=Wallemia mellicola TaxID=1708541 RepID=A0A4T0PZQ4_9BASI|nr:MFS general substrate transporter [Wallemia mellicola]TIC16309.1 MFS general substrate transporter [Wallemia mellicola]
MQVSKKPSFNSSESDKAWCKRNRAFVTRLDVYFLTWAYLSYLTKQIDSSNYKTAYVNGMQEDLNLYGDELNYFNTFYRIGYGVFIPISEAILASNIIRVSYWLPTLELIWGIATAVIAVADSAKVVYGLRFIIGICEASSYAGLMTLIVYWYRSSELAKRLSIFGTSYPLANIFTSSLQIAINEGMDGVQGLAGWRWLFIWNGIITVIIAISGYFMIPDALQETHALWMTSNMREIAEERFLRTGFRKPVKLTFRQFYILIRKALTSWITYAFTLTYAVWSFSQDSNTWLSLFLKSLTNEDGSKRFSNNQVTAIPIGGYVVQIVFMLIWAYLSDIHQRRCRYIVAQQITILVGTIILSTWPKSFGLKMFAYYFLYLSNSAGPLIVAWMSDTIGKQNTEMRTIYIGLGVCVVNAIDSFQNIFIYPASEAPNYRIGYKAAAAYAFASIVGCFVWKILAKKDPTASGLKDTNVPILMYEIKGPESNHSKASSTDSSPLGSPIEEEIGNQSVIRESK